MPSVTNMVLERLKAPVRDVIKHYWEDPWWAYGLPDFIVIGAQKAGTTSLFYYLSQHPQLVPPKRKEIHYFDGGRNPDVDDFRKGQPWYRKWFPRKSELAPHQKTFEITPLYLFNPLAPYRIAQLLPNVKLVALLRNPTERALSHYFHAKRRGEETLPLLDALQAEEERLAPILRERDYKNTTYINQSYKSRGLYRQQLERYLELFPAERLLILDCDDLFTAPEATLQRVFKFVEVDTHFLPSDLKPRNVAASRETVHPTIRQYLSTYFQRPNTHTPVVSARQQRHFHEKHFDEYRRRTASCKSTGRANRFTRAKGHPATASSSRSPRHGVCWRRTAVRYKHNDECTRAQHVDGCLP